MPKVIAIVGPTASGKSALGVFLAQKLNGEIISADSRQVYRGLNLGTGKVTKREMGGIPHHLLDVVSPKKIYSVSEFEKAATHVISGLIYQATPKLPIVVGGTGLYVDVLLGRVALPNVPPNPALRARLEKKSVEQLFAMLKKADPARAGTIEPQHKRRIIRAIEIVHGSKKVPEKKSGSRKSREDGIARRETRGLFGKDFFADPQILWLGLNPSEETLRKNIRIRLLARMRAGMVAEARRLHGAGLSYKRMEGLGLEYRYLALFLQKKLTKTEMVEQLERAIYKYAKRQRTWFKRNKNIVWLKNSPGGQAGKEEALRQARRFVG